MRSGIDFGSFFRGSNLEKSLKTIGFSMVVAIFKKSTFSKKYRKNMDFGVDFGGQNHEKSRKNGKPCVFLTSIFHRFFKIFYDFGSILGGPGGSKNQ